MIPVPGTCLRTPSWQHPLFDNAASLNKPDLNPVHGNQYIRNMCFSTADGGLQWTERGPSERKSEFIS